MPEESFRETQQHPRKALRTLIIVLIAVVVVIAGVIGMVVRNGMKPELINETADIDQALLDQGTIYSFSKGGIARGQGMNVGVHRVGRDDEGRPQAEISFGAEDLSTGGVRWVSLGDSLTLDGVGTIYLVSLTSFSQTQQISVLFIPA